MIKVSKSDDGITGIAEFDYSDIPSLINRNVGEQAIKSITEIKSPQEVMVTVATILATVIAAHSPSAAVAEENIDALARIAKSLAVRYFNHKAHLPTYKQ